MKNSLTSHRPISTTNNPPSRLSKLPSNRKLLKQESSRFFSLNQKYSLQRETSTTTVPNLPEYLSPEDTIYYAEVFKMFDSDKSGEIDLNELQEAVRSTGMEPTENELKMMITTVTGSQDKQTVSLQEFLKMVSIIKAQGAAHTGNMTSQLNLEEAFRAMDTDENGFITASDLFRVLDNLGERLPADQLYEMLSFADADLDGKVGIEDFCKMVTSSSQN
jgi:Ca2+-binding EF-hand superfamily protein